MTVSKRPLSIAAARPLSDVDLLDQLLDVRDRLVQFLLLGSLEFDFNDLLDATAADDNRLRLASLVAHTS